MGLEDFYNRFKIDMELSLAEKTGFNPYYKKIQSGLEDPLKIDGKQYINLAANNYLGLGADQRVKEAAVEAIRKYGVSLCGTLIATGYIDLYKDLEVSISKFLDLEDTIILPSCYQANNGLFVSICGKEDLIVVDHYAHSSMIQGIKTVGCKIRPFLHNNTEHLEKILKNSSQYRQVFVVTESVFSTEGSIAPFNEIYEIANKYNAFVIVDDSHGIGVIGEKGKGILQDSKVENFQGIYTASLGKALGCTGGIICGRKDIIDYLRYYCPHLVYSTAIPPGIIGAVGKVLEIVGNEFDQMSKRLWSYKDIISKSLKNKGFVLADGRAPIISIKTGSAERTISLAKEFYNKGILTTPFIEPSVPPGEGILRLIPGANLKKDSIDKVVEVIDSMCI